MPPTRPRLRGVAVALTTATFLSVPVAAAPLAGLTIASATPQPGGPTVITAAASSTVTIGLGSGTTVIARPKTAVVITGTITNHGTDPISSAEAQVAVGPMVLDTTQLLQRWSAGRLETATTKVGDQKLGTLGPGQSTTFTVTVPAGKLTYTYGLAALPMVISLRSGSRQVAVQRTTLTWQSKTSVVSPIRTAFIVPLTLPADPALFGPTGPARTAAWQAAIGPGSRVDELLSRLSGLPVTWVVDPTLVDPPTGADGDLPAIPPTSPSPSSASSSSGQTPSGSTSGSEVATSAGSPSASEATPSPGQTEASTTAATGTGSDTSPTTQSASSSSAESPDTGVPGAAPDQVDALVQQLRGRLAAIGSEQQLWWTPYDDPDLSALTAGAAAKPLAARMLSRKLPSALTDISSTVVAWPAVAPTEAALKSVEQVWTGALHQQPLVLASERVVEQASAPLSVAGRHTAGAKALLALDDRSGAVLAGAGDPGVRAQELMADTIALYQQQPGANRSIAFAVPRDATTDPRQLAQIIGQSTHADWLSPTTADELVTGDLPSSAVLRTPTKGGPAVPSSPMDAAVLHSIDEEHRDIATIDSLVVDPEEIIQARSRLADTAGSTRWRGHQTQLFETVALAGNALQTILGKVQVTPSSVNFFTDSGQLTVTINNDLSRPVHGVQLQLEPRKYLLRIKHEPGPININASSRASVRASVAAVGAGEVPVDAVLRAPDGTVIGKQPPAQLKLNVRPTSTWLFAVLGILAALILVVGVIRSVRRGPRQDEVQPLDPKPTQDDAIVATEMPQRTRDEATDQPPQDNPDDMRGDDE